MAPGNDATLTAQFVTQYLVTTAVNISNGGSISNGGWLDAGSSLQISATPAPGFRFDGFTGDLGGSTNPQTIVVDGPKAVTANFSVAIQPQAPLSVTGASSSAAFGASFAVGTLGGSGTGALTFTTIGVCNNTGAQITMTSGTGTCFITATKAADTNYYEATSPQVPVNATKAAQTTLVVTGAPQNAVYGTTFAVGSSGGSGNGAIGFATSGACSNSAAQITMTSGVGICSITAIKASDANYDPATSPPARVNAQPAPPPAAPSNLSATAKSANQIQLTWTDNATNEDGFKIERGPMSTGPFVQVADVGANVTTYVDMGLSASTKYYYRLKAYAANSSADSSYSNAASATTLTPPAAPTMLSATAASSTQINLSWTNKAKNATGVKVSRSTDGMTFTVIAPLSATTTSYADTDSQRRPPTTIESRRLTRMATPTTRILRTPRHSATHRRYRQHRPH